jgi:hypothetical protein
MADKGCFSVASSNFLLNSFGKEDEYVCERCRDCETQLKEALDELSSVQTIIILQNELLLSRASITACTEDQSPLERPHSKPITAAWTLAASNNTFNKSQNHEKRVRSKIESYDNCVSITNRFSPFSNLEGAFTDQCETQKRSCFHTKNSQKYRSSFKR